MDIKVKSTGKRLITTILASGMAFAISYIINFTLTPYITNNIGADAYGFVSLAKTFASYAMIAATAINSYSARFIVVEYHKSEFEKANEYFSTTIISNLFLAITAMVFAICFTANITSFLAISSSLVLDVRILFVLIFLNFGFTILGTSFSVPNYIANRLDIIGHFKTVGYLIEAIILLVLYTTLDAKVYFVGIALCFQSFFVLIVNVWMSGKFAPKLKKKSFKFSLNAARNLILNGIWNSLNSLGNTLNTGLDLIVCNLMLTDLGMGQLAIAKTINTMFVSLYQLIAQPFQPLFLKAYADNDTKKLLSIFKLSMKISGLLSSLAFAIFFSLGKIYYRLWIPNQDVVLIWNLTVIGCFSGIFEGVIYPLYYIYTLKIKNRIPCIITIIGGLLNISGMYILIKYTNLGIYSVVFTTAVIMTIISAVTNPLYMAHCMKMSWYTFYPPILKNTLSCLVMTIIFTILAYLVAPEGWVCFIILALLLVAVGVVIHVILVFEKEERNLVIIQIRKKVKGEGRKHENIK